MPIYEYTCQDCQKEFELLIRGKEKPQCPGCGRENLLRSLSVPAAHTGGSRPSECPVQNTCGMKHCCGQNCGAGEWG